MRRFALILLLCGLPLIAEEHGGGGEHAQPSAIWKWTNFGILAALIVYAVAKNAPGFFRQRTADIQKSILEAKRIREEAEARAAAIDKKLTHLSAEIDSMRTQARREMENEAIRIKEETSLLVSRVEDHARQEIDSLTKHAENELQAYAAQLAIDVARTKIQSRINPDSQAVLVNRFLENVSKQPERVN